MLWADIGPRDLPPPVVTCWDGTEAAADDCPALEGLAALRWVFPSFRPDADGCEPVAYQDIGTPRPLEYACPVRVGGRRASVNYSERSDLARGLSYFDNRYTLPPEKVARGTRLVYRDAEPRKDGTYEVTVALTKYPFAVTVSATNERLRDQALDTYVRFRPSGTLLVRKPAPADTSDTADTLRHRRLRSAPSISPGGWLPPPLRARRGGRRSG